MSEIPTLRWPSQAALTPRTCRHCQGHLIAPDPPYQARCVFCSRPVCQYTTDRPRAPLTIQEIHPRRGRPSGRTPKPVPKLRAYKAGDTALMRLLDLLACGERMHRDDLCLALDVDSLHLRQIVYLLRERGHTIMTIRSDYLLLAEVRA